MNKHKEHEVINELLGYERLKIIQRPDMFNFSLDSTLLADFTLITPRVKTIMDFGTGHAPIPLFLSLKTTCNIIGVEIQNDVYELAKRNVALNNLENQVTILHEDITKLHKRFAPSSIDIITCNPPFFKYRKTAQINQSDYKTIARHEVHITLEGIIKSAKALLTSQGKFVMVHRAERLSEIIQVFKQYQFAIKRLRFVHPKADLNANMILIEASNNGKEGIKILPPLYVHHDEGYTDEVMNIFHYGRK